MCIRERIVYEPKKITLRTNETQTTLSAMYCIATVRLERGSPKSVPPKSMPQVPEKRGILETTSRRLRRAQFRTEERLLRSRSSDYVLKAVVFS